MAENAEEEADETAVGTSAMLVWLLRFEMREK
jgi:hypothetical protein